SHLRRVLDPAGGSWAIERLTRDLMASAWERLQEIERAGGMVAALRAGAVQKMLAATRARRAKALATRRLQLTAVSEFPDPGEAAVPAPVSARAIGDGRSDPIEPLVAHRLAEPFEALRECANRLTQAGGRRPAVFIAALGTLAEHRARVLWARNLLAVGGITTVEGEGGRDIAAIVAAWRASGCHEAVIVGPDALYAELAARLATGLKAAGARYLALAGKPDADMATWRAAGIDEVIFHGMDIVAFLENMLERMEAAS
ncbi:MAG: methylmalonyl-CoA mutase family protein, partial [Rhodothalassiaceae bacterium]